MSFRLLTALCTAFALLAACGVKGPLVLPKNKPLRQAESPAPATVSAAVSATAASATLSATPPATPADSSIAPGKTRP